MTGFYTLFQKEWLRFWKVAVQTVLAASKARISEAHPLAGGGRPWPGVPPPLARRAASPPLIPTGAVPPLDVRALLRTHYLMPPALADLVARCLQWSPSHRITAADAVKHDALWAAGVLSPQSKAKLLKAMQVVRK